MKATKDDVRYAYRLLLGREPDFEGLAHHYALVSGHGLSTADLIQGFMRSDEYLSRDSRQPVLQEVEIHGAKIFPWHGDRLIGDQAAATKDYEPHVLPVFLESLRPGDYVLDVGANIGIYSLTAAKRVGSDGMVYAIEPVAKNIQSLCAGILGNKFENVSVMPVAASDKCSVIGVLRYSDSSNGIVDSNASAASGSDFVPTHRLDRLLPDIGRLDVVKIDIEGHEPIAWEGLKSLVAKHRPLIFTEFSPVAIRNHSRTDPEYYLRALFEFANGRIDVLHQEGNRIACVDAAAVMHEWKEANKRFKLDGTLHLDLVVDTRV